MKEITIKKNDAGQRLDRFVGKAVPLLPESLLQKYIRLKRIKLNGKGAKRDTRLNEGDVLQLYINDEFFEKPREENSYLKVGTPKLNIVYEDENILLVDKKPGVLCHSAGQWDYNTLIANIQAYMAQKGEWKPREENSFAPALCNRIDRNTGGIVIAAKNAEALRVMNQKIKDDEISKFYVCIAHGVFDKKQDTLHGYLRKDAASNTVKVFDKKTENAKEIITKYRVLKQKKDLSLLEVELVTGRTHQIRAHMAFIGHPLLGEGKYGHNADDRRLGFTHQALYSSAVDFEFTDSLAYLNGRTYSVDCSQIDFMRLFPDVKTERLFK
mgnify:CR=1 FL=1